MVSVAALAKDKNLPAYFLTGLGLRDTPGGVIIPYYTSAGEVWRNRIRTDAKAKVGSRWDSSKNEPIPYGLWRLEEARKSKRIILVEGESDCWVLWHQGFPALGLPGASMGGKIKGDHLAGIDRLYIWVEPDRGGETFLAGIKKTVHALGWGGLVFELHDSTAKDPADLWLSEKKQFKKTMRYLLASARRAEPFRPPQPLPTKDRSAPKFGGHGQVTNAHIERARHVPIQRLLDTKDEYIVCPFHEDHRPTLWLKNGFGYCFACNKHVDSIGWLMQVHGFSFVEAVRELA